MSRYFFDATSADSEVTDLQGREIRYKDELRPAMVEAVRAIREFLGEDHEAEDWSLAVRLGKSNRIAAVPFEEVVAREETPTRDAPVEEDRVEALAA